MAPSATTPPRGVSTSELTAAAVAKKILQTAPGLYNK